MHTLSSHICPKEHSKVEVRNTAHSLQVKSKWINIIRKLPIARDE